MPWTSRFYQRDLLQFFREHAEIVQWAPAAQCGCGNTPESPPNMACAVCGGFGYFYPQPLHTIRVVLTRVTQQETLAVYGLAQVGDLLCDQPPGSVPLAPWDLMLTTWSDGLPFQGETLVRGSGVSDTLTWRAAQVVTVLQTDPSTGSVTTYVPTTDYTWSGRTVTWVSGASQPAAGTQYTVRYNATYEWVVLPPGVVREERGTNLGQRTVLRKRDLWVANPVGGLLPG